MSDAIREPVQARKCDICGKQFALGEKYYTLDLTLRFDVIPRPRLKYRIPSQFLMGDISISIPGTNTYQIERAFFCEKDAVQVEQFVKELGRKITHDN